MTETVQRALGTIKPQDFTWDEQEAIRDIINGEAPWFNETEAQSIIDQIEPGYLFLLTAFKRVLALRIKEKAKQERGGKEPLEGVTKSLEAHYVEELNYKVKRYIAAGDYGLAGDNLIDLCAFYGKDVYAEANKLNLMLPNDKKNVCRAMVKGLKPEKDYAPRYLTIFAVPGDLPKEPYFINGKQQFNEKGEPVMVDIARYERTVGNTRVEHNAGIREIGLAKGNPCVLVEMAIVSKYLNQPKDKDGKRNLKIKLGSTPAEFFHSLKKYNNDYYKATLIVALERVMNTLRSQYKVDNGGNVIKTDIEHVNVGNLSASYHKDKDGNYASMAGEIDLNPKYAEYVEKNFLYVDFSVVNALMSSERDMAIYLYCVNKASYLSFKNIPIKASYEEIGELYSDPVVRPDHKREKIRESFDKVLKLSGLPLKVDVSGFDPDRPGKRDNLIRIDLNEGPLFIPAAKDGKRGAILRRKQI